MIDVDAIMTRTPKARCPFCQATLTAATAIDGTKQAPRPGDWSVCLTCGGPLIFNRELVPVAATAAELAREPIERQREIYNAQRLARSIAPIP